MKTLKIFLLLTAIFICPNFALAKNADELFNELRQKILQVKDYVAEVNLKIDVAYMKVPLLKGKLYFKAPDLMKLERNGGISILPKKNINLTLSNLIPTGKVTVIDMGTTLYKAKSLRLIKVVPDDEKSSIVLTKIWIDEQNLLVIHAETTTYEEGSLIMDLEYNHFVNYSLPDKVKIFMDLKDYKLPQGLTMDYNDGNKKQENIKKTLKQKGTIEINYKNYVINKGISTNFFKG